MTDDFTVRLEQVFQGPLDLLLHLVREAEIEIHEIEINRIIGGYLAYLRRLETPDLEFAGEFLVMAATLMAIKSRSLLPREEVDLEEELDPRDELIERLLEYRRFKSAAQELETLHLERMLLHERGYRGEVRAHRTEPELDLGELTAWDLLAVYSRLLRETAADRPRHIAVDPRPLRYYVERVVSRVRSERELSLRRLLEGFEDGPARETLVGSFCALLELVRLEVIRIRQEDTRGDIEIHLREDMGTSIDDIVRSAGFDDEGTEEPEGDPEPAEANVADEPDEADQEPAAADADPETADA